MCSRTTAEVSGWGPFFAVTTHPADAVPTAPWRPVRELIDEPDLLAERVEAVRSRLATGRRVAASVTHLGLTARLISPVLGCFVHGGSGPSIDGMWWQPEPGSMFPVSVEDRPGRLTDLVAGLTAQLVRAMRAFSVSERVLWGNVASAVNGAATMIGAARPDLADRAATLATTLLDLPALRDAGVRHADGRFQRRSCCLIYQAGDRRALCGDCVLAADRVTVRRRPR